MVWLFVILGLSAFIAAAYGVKSRADEGQLSGEHIMAIALLVVAWFVGHLSIFGWAALVIAGGLEYYAWRSPKIIVPPKARVTPLVTLPRIETPAPPPPPKVLKTEEPIQFQPGNGSAYVTHVLLTSSQDITGDVLTASLRRGGRRDAALVGKRSDGVWQIQFGTIFLELSKGPQIPTKILEDAAAQTFDWPEALDSCRDHAATVRLAIPLHENAARSDIVRLHHQAHAALSEFAPIVGIYWCLIRCPRQ